MIGPYGGQELEATAELMMMNVLYGCENWPLALREEHRLTLFENKVLRKLFGVKRYEITGGRRKLHTVSYRRVHLARSTLLTSMLVTLESFLIF